VLGRQWMVLLKELHMQQMLHLRSHLSLQHLLTHLLVQQGEEGEATVLVKGLLQQLCPRRQHVLHRQQSRHSQHQHQH